MITAKRTTTGELLGVEMLVLLLLLPISTAAIGFSQSVEIRGKLICHDKPEKDVRVKLYEKGVVFDTKMDDTTSNSDGEFHLKGTETEITSIDPRVNIYHDCDDGWTPCQRRITVSVPSSYKTRGNTAKRVFNLGVMQLAGKFSGETRDCIHRER